jgi:hypothetical protein
MADHAAHLGSSSSTSGSSERTSPVTRPALPSCSSWYSTSRTSCRPWSRWKRHGRRRATAVQETFRKEFVEPAVERYRTGDKEGAVDRFFSGVLGPHYRDRLERGLPGGFDQAVSDADTLFTQELPALW